MARELLETNVIGTMAVTQAVFPQFRERRPALLLMSPLGANARMEGVDDPVYSEMVQRVISNMRESSGPVTRAEDVAKAVWRAVAEPRSPMRLPAGADAEAWAAEMA